MNFIMNNEIMKSYFLNVPGLVQGIAVKEHQFYSVWTFG